MTDLLIEHKWVFLIGAEIFFWVCAAAFFLVRYWLEMGRLGNLLLVLIVVEEVIANLFILGLGALDYRQAGRITGYQVVTVAFILYALTIGRHDAKRLDAYLKRKVARWKGQPLPEASRQEAVQDEAGRYRRGWYKHLTIFVVGQAVLLAIGESWIPMAIAGESPTESSGLTAASWGWAIAFAVDTIWSLSYTIWPSGEKQR